MLYGSHFLAGIPPEYRHYLLQIDSPWKSLLDSAALLAQERSQHVWDKYLTSVIDQNGTSTFGSNKADGSNNADSPLSFAELFGVFFLLLIGVVVGFASFVGEKLLSSQIRLPLITKALATVTTDNWYMTSPRNPL